MDLKVGFVVSNSLNVFIFLNHFSDINLYLFKF